MSTQRPESTDAGLEYYRQAELWSPSGPYGDPAELARADFVADLALRARPARILEVGAGNAMIANRLNERGLEVVAFDQSDVALESVVGPKAIGDIRTMPFEDRSFDLLIASQVLEHLPSETLGRAREELSRVARRHIIVTVPNQEDLVAAAAVCPECHCRSSPHRHVQSFGRADFTGLCVGFTPESICAFGPVDARPRRLVALLRRDLMETWDWPPAAICPQCGYRRGGADTAERRQPGGARRLGRLLRVRRRRWLAAVLTRDSAPASHRSQVAR